MYVGVSSPGGMCEKLVSGVVPEVMGSGVVGSLASFVLSVMTHIGLLG